MIFWNFYTGTGAEHEGFPVLYIFDGTGNPAALVTSESYKAFAYNYDPFGVPTLTADSGGNGAPQNPYLFKQGTQDRTTGWVKYGARYYNPTTGRWTQQDTLDTPLNPANANRYAYAANANRYAYAANNPINYADPAGLSCVTDTISHSIVPGAIFGAGVGAAFGAGTGTVLGLGVGAPVGAVAGGVLGAIEGIVGGFATGLIGGLLYC